MRFVHVHLLFCSQAWQLIHRLWMLSAFLLWWLLSTHRLTFCLLAIIISKLYHAQADANHLPRKISRTKMYAALTSPTALLRKPSTSLLVLLLSCQAVRWLMRTPIQDYVICLSTIQPTPYIQAFRDATLHWARNQRWHWSIYLESFYCHFTVWMFVVTNLMNMGCKQIVYTY